MVTTSHKHSLYDELLPAVICQAFGLTKYQNSDLFFLDITIILHTNSEFTDGGGGGGVGVKERIKK